MSTTDDIAKPETEKSIRIRAALLKHWRTSSDREIAKMIGVSNRPVSQCRKELEENGLIVPRKSSTHASGPSLHRVCTSAIRPAPLNDKLYDPVDENSPQFQSLVEDICENGLLEHPVVSADGYILSGHRRYAALAHIGINWVTVRVDYDVSYAVDRDKFLKLLASYNRQRVKTTSEQIREEVALTSDDSVDSVEAFREEAAEITSDGIITLRPRRQRSVIRDKMELRQAIIEVMEAERNNWPLSDRAIHYRLLNIPGLVRNDITRTPYQNTLKSYKDLTNMVTRLRITGDVQHDAISDETRPVIQWDTHRCVGDFVRRECDQFLKGYYRDLMQSQPNWVELLVEKNTVASQLKPIAMKYRIPMTSGRGYSSFPPRRDMMRRFKESGRQNLLIIVASDFDPEGEDIPVSFGASLRDDFDLPVENLKLTKAALTHKQVLEMDLHEGQFGKDKGSRYKQFVDRYGERVWELESLSSDQLRQFVDEGVRRVLDIDSFNAEIDREQREQNELRERRRELMRAVAFGSLDGLGGGE